MPAGWAPWLAAVGAGLGSTARAQGATGSLNRTIAVDGLTHRYPDLRPAEYLRTIRWPVMLFLHGSGERSTDSVGSVQGSRCMAEALRAAGPRPRARPRSAVILALAAGSVLALATGCEEGEPSPLSDGPALGPARVALAASFIGDRAGALRRLLHAEVIVQPPEPDSALRGAAAADYLESLARQSDLTRSELAPTAMSLEGDFLLERGTWFLEMGQRTFRSRYTLRWRESPAGWKVTLWRWTLFR